MDSKITEPARDPFAIARHDADGDARVLALFHDWLDACREMDRIPDDDEAGASDAYDRRAEIEDEITATPGGPVALAVKIYIYQRMEEASYWTPDLAMLRCPQLLDGTPDLTISLLRDAARLVPELAELAAPIIHEDAVLIDADIEVQWCREVGKDVEAARRLPGALDRIARTPAKTDRGRAIKLKHAGIDDQQKAELRARAEAIAAENNAPLPDEAEGDAQLIEAERRFSISRERRHALYDEFASVLESEAGSADEAIFATEMALVDVVERTDPSTLAGAVAKLRVIIWHEDLDEKDDPYRLHQVLDLLEREAQP
jgi:hypothetical protein